MPGLQGSGYPLIGGAGSSIIAHEAATNPGVNNDSADTAGIGVMFNEGDHWFNTVTGVLWICSDASVGAADWDEIVLSDAAPTDNDVVRFDGTDGNKIQTSGWQIDDISNLRAKVDGTGNIGVSISTFRPDNIWAKTSIAVESAFMTTTAIGVSGALAIAETPVEAKALVLRNSSDATALLNQFGPSHYDVGSSWETGGGTPQTVGCRRELQTVQGATAGGAWHWSFDINGAGYASKMYLTQVGHLYITGGGLASNFQSTTYFSASGGAIICWQNDYSTGLGLTENFYTAANAPMALISSNASRDAVGAIVAATVFDRNAATITNASTMRIHSFGWTDNTNTYNELVSVRGNGDMHAAGSMYVTGKIQSGNSGLSVNTVINLDFTDTGVTGTNETLSSVTAARALSLRSIRTDGVGNIAIASTIDNNTASITNASTMRIHSFGWTDNTNTYTELAAIYADGDFECNVIRAAGAITAVGDEVRLTTTAVGSPGPLGASAIAYGIQTQVDSRAMGFLSRRADGAGNVSISFSADVNNATINAGHIISQWGWTDNADVYTNLAYIRGDGAFVLTDTSSATIQGQEADGATAIGLLIDTSVTYATAGAKLLSIQNNSSEKAYVSKDGDISFASQLQFAGVYTVATAPTALGDGAIARFSDGDAGADCLGLSLSGTFYRIVLGAAIAT